MDDGIADVVIACRDDEDALGGIKPCRDGINHARADEVRDEGIHGAVPAEDEARGAQDEEVEKHDDFADRKRRPAAHPDRHDFRAIRRPPVLDDDAYAESYDNPAKNCRQEGIVCRRHHFIKPGRAEGKDDDGKHG